MPSPSTSSSGHERVVHTLNGDSRVDEPSRLNRYQRTLVMGAGVAVSFVLVLLTGVVLKSTVTDYVEDRYTDFALRQTRLQLEFLERERTLRAAILHEDIEFSPVLINSAPQQARLAAQRHKYFCRARRRAPTVVKRLGEDRSATWFPPATDPFSEQPAIRLVMPAFA